MNKILGGIRSVPGVWGVLAIDKRKALIYQLMPSNYETSVVKDIAVPCMNLGQIVEKNLVADFFFENGKGRVYNTRDTILIVLGRSEMNFDVLGNICRETVAVIGRRFLRNETMDGDLSKNGADITFDFLIKTMNIMASNVQQRIGSYLVTKHLRNAKDIVVQQHRFLASIAVDNNGTIALMTGSIPYKGNDLINGFAQLASHFADLCARSTGKLDISDLRDLTSEVKDKLETSGFYDIYQNSRAEIKNKTGNIAVAN